MCIRDSINAVELLLQEYDNVITYSKAQEVEIGGLGVLFIPWINDENSEDTFKLIKDSSVRCAMGHLELTGFRAHRGCIMENGLDSQLFENYEVVFSGPTTLDHPMGRSSIWEIPTRCSGTMSTTQEDSTSSTQKP